MKAECEAIQSLILEAEAAGFDVAAKSHIAACAECSAFAASMKELQSEIDSQPVYRASDKVLGALAANVQARVKSQRRVSKLLFWICAVILTGIAAIIASEYFLSPGESLPRILGFIEGGSGAVLMLGAAGGALLCTFKRRFVLSGTLATMALMTFVVRSASNTFFNTESLGSDTEWAFSPAQSAPISPAFSVDSPVVKEEGERKREVEVFKKTIEQLSSTASNERLNAPKVSGGFASQDLDEGRFDAGKDQNLKAKQEARAGEKPAKRPLEDSKSDSRMMRKLSGIGDGFASGLERSKGVNSESYADVTSSLKERQLEMGPLSRVHSGRIVAGQSSAPAAGKIESVDPVARFWGSQYRIDNLEFKSPVGYWANTYIPGDPLLRALAANLGANNSAILSRYAGREVALDRNSRPAVQPLDIPEHAALGVSLTGDISATAGPARMLLQLSIKGAERKSALRQPLHVAIVVDPAASDSALIQSLLTAFDRSKIEGDKFGLVVSGLKEGTMIPLGGYRFGTVKAATDKLSSGSEPADPSFTPAKALAAALKMVKDAETKDSTFGSSTIVYLSGATSAGGNHELETIAYNAGLEGIPVNTIAVGAGASADALGAIALAGQGTKLQVINPSEAEGAVKEELAATSKVVARALRLNIKLAPGTKLIDVLGSKSLDEADAEKVRQAEVSIDKHMEKNFGIVSDRGADENGIEVIIPAFYSGDSHVVLLDVLAQGPGPVADVQVKYKDLIEHQNGVAHASFSLKSGEQPGIERNVPVLKNLLSFKLAGAFQEAVIAVRRGDIAGGVDSLSKHAALISGLQTQVSGLDGDADLARDCTMIAEYIALLRSPAPTVPAGKESLIRSMELAGKKKISQSGSE